MKKSTDELLNILKSKSSIDEYLKENTEQFSSQTHTLAEMLEQILKENNVSKSQARDNSGLSPTYFYELLRGAKTDPSRDKLIMFCIGIKADCEQTKRVLGKLKLAPLYSKDPRDSIIMFGLIHKLSVIDINILLDEHNFQILE